MIINIVFMIKLTKHKINKQRNNWKVKLKI